MGDGSSDMMDDAAAASQAQPQTTQPASAAWQSPQRLYSADSPHVEAHHTVFNRGFAMMFLLSFAVGGFVFHMRKRRFYAKVEEEEEFVCSGTDSLESGSEDCSPVSPVRKR